MLGTDTFEVYSFDVSCRIRHWVFSMFSLSVFSLLTFSPFTFICSTLSPLTFSLLMLSFDVQSGNHYALYTVYIQCTVYQAKRKVKQTDIVNSNDLAHIATQIYILPSTKVAVLVEYRLCIDPWSPAIPNQML
jgi:hypothetical protein